MLRSMLAQMEFCYVIRQYDHGGISFGMYLHVLEEHPLSWKEDALKVHVRS